ncbi:MAG: hypothetical protein DRN99_06745 [Thermoproteota archaeon]|nr:MAG: hypothetical protein DRN99_06745 [Candidatus Korarchaeota archaeon]
MRSDPLAANMARLLSTALVLAATLPAAGLLDVLESTSTSSLALAAASGVVGQAIGDTLYLLTLKLADVSVSVALTSTYPLFSVIASLALGEPVALRAVVGALAIVSGMPLVTGVRRSSRVSMLGAVVAVVTAAVWSLSILLLDLALPGASSSPVRNSMAINTVRVLAAAIAVTPPVVLKRKAMASLSAREWALLLSAGLVAIGAGWVFLGVGLVKAGALVAVPLSSTTPLFSALAGRAVFRERLTPQFTAGAALIVAGSCLVSA